MESTVAKQVDQNELIVMLEKMRVLKEEIGSIDNQAYKSTVPFRYGKREGADAIHIPKCMDVEGLFHALGFVTSKLEAYNNAVKLANYSKSPVPCWNNTPLEIWKADMLLRLKVLTRETRAKDLDKDMEVIANAISPELLAQQKITTVFDKYKSETGD